MTPDKNSALIALSERARTHFGRMPFVARPEPQKVFFAIWELEGQMNNGGFDEYFDNSDSDIIAYAPVALRAIGAATCQRIVERALALVSPLPETHAARQQALDELDAAGRQALAELDQEFVLYPDNLTELLFAFVTEHADAFGSRGTLKAQ